LTVPQICIYVTIVDYKIIENKTNLKKIEDEIKNVILFIVPQSFEIHPSKQEVSLVFVYDLETLFKYLIIVDHSDFESELSFDDIRDVLQNKKITSLDSKKDFHVLGYFPSVDINILSYISSLEILDASTTYSNKYSNFYLNNFKNLKCPNKFVPVGYFMKLFDTVIEFYDSTFSKFSKNIDTFSYKGMFELNMVLGKIESSGMKIDFDVFSRCFDQRLHCNVIDDRIYSEYSFFTSTGRPSNKFGGINFAALSKKDDTRLSLVSRFGEHGFLVDMDFQACHPHLIANLVGYCIPDDTNIYEYLGKFYFKKDTLSDEDIAKSKMLTFKQLYGHVDKEFEEIPYFKKKIEYNQQIVDFFRKHGYIETPIFRRQLSSKNFGTENAEKMFAYLLQSYETEINLIKARKVLNLLDDYKSKLILYTYDSFLIDFCKDDSKNLILKIKSLLENDGMPVTVKIGTNFKTLKKISL
jgi:hypothetical protein